MGKMKGPLIIFGVLAVLVIGYFYVKPMLFEKKQRSTSDSVGSAEVIRMAGDSYLGYWFINSPEMKRHGPRQGIEVDFADDGGAYAERLQKFANKEYDCIVLPVNSYIQHGVRHKFPGVIVASISESKGADALVGFGDVISANGSINDLNNPDLTIVYTSESPSSFLLDMMITDFDLDLLKNSSVWRREEVSSEAVYELAKKATKDKSIGDAFVMWEPEVSKAIDKLGMVPIWGSDKFAGYIVDVFVFHREYLSKNPETVRKFFKAYFRVLDMYASDQARMIKEMSKSTNLKESVVETMYKKIDWFNLRENCTEQFGIELSVGSMTNDGIISTIISCTDVLSRTGKFKASDLRDPYRIVNSAILEEMAASGAVTMGGSGTAAKTDFRAISYEEWAKLKVVGTMRIEPITFQSSSNRLDDQGKEVVDRVAEMLVNNYPSYRVAVRGHTGRGDLEANTKLSTERAQVVVQRLIAVHDIDEDRLHPEGMADTQPLKKKPGESTRSYRTRMPRVEFALLEGSGL